MKGHLEPLYNNQQIFIPPNFPHLLKVYAKAAIRTQPYDLLTWSASYFRALADGKLPPVKARLEYPIIRSNGGLSPGYLKLIIRQFSGSTDIDKTSLEKVWTGICLNDDELKQILCLAGVYNESNFPLNKFVTVATGFLTKNLTQTMIMLCELFTDEPDGGSAAISSDLFVDFYTFLSAIDGSKENKFIDGRLEGKAGVKNNDNSNEIIENESSTDDLKNKAFTLVDVPADTSEETVFDDLKDYVENKAVQLNRNNNGDITESSDNLPATSTDTDDVFEPVVSTQSESESTQSSSLRNIKKTPVKFHEITEQESMSFDDPYKYSQDEFEASETPEDSVTSSSRNRTVFLRVFSEDGQKIDSLSAMSMREGEASSPFKVLDDNTTTNEQKADISNDERQAIIEQKNKDEKIKNMEEIMDSIEDLAEKTQLSFESSKTPANNEFLENEKKIIEQDNESFENKKVDVNPDAKGVVNPIFKGLFDNVVDKMCVVSAFQEAKDMKIPEIIVVPPIPGIGPIINDSITEEFLKYVRETASDQCDMFMPRDVRHYFCPPLE